LKISGQIVNEAAKCAALAWMREIAHFSLVRIVMQKCAW